MNNDFNNVINLDTKRQETRVNFKDFAQYIIAEDEETSTRTLRDLLKLDYETSQNITSYVIQRYRHDQDHILKLIHLKAIILNESPNKLLEEIQFIFGCDAIISMQIYLKLIGDKSLQ